MSSLIPDFLLKFINASVGRVIVIRLAIDQKLLRIVNSDLILRFPFYFDGCNVTLIVVSMFVPTVFFVRLIS